MGRGNGTLGANRSASAARNNCVAGEPWPPTRPAQGLAAPNVTNARTEAWPTGNSPQHAARA
eukprot:7586355-Lingulodinium_polyedra.AAC.1